MEGMTFLAILMTLTLIVVALLGSYTLFCELVWPILVSKLKRHVLILLSQGEVLRNQLSQMRPLEKLPSSFAFARTERATERA